VLIALGMVLGAERDDFDVAVLFSAETELFRLSTRFDRAANDVVRGEPLGEARQDHLARPWVRAVPGARPRLA